MQALGAAGAGETTQPHVILWPVLVAVATGVVGVSVTVTVGLLRVADNVPFAEHVWPVPNVMLLHSAEPVKPFEKFSATPNLAESKPASSAEACARSV